MPVDAKKPVVEMAPVPTPGGVQVHMPLVPMPLVPMPPDADPDAEHDVPAEAENEGAAWGRKRLFRRGKPAHEAVVAVPEQDDVAEPAPDAAAVRTSLSSVDRTVVFVGTVAGFVGGAVSGAAVTLLLH